MWKFDKESYYKYDNERLVASIIYVNSNNHYALLLHTNDFGVIVIGSVERRVFNPVKCQQILNLALHKSETLERWIENKDQWYKDIQKEFSGWWACGQGNSNRHMCDNLGRITVYIEKNGYDLYDAYIVTSDFYVFPLGELKSNGIASRIICEKAINENKTLSEWKYLFPDWWYNNVIKKQL